MRQNLALVLALEGKFAEAEQISRQDMTAQAARANVAAIRQMIAQNDSWRDLQTGAVQAEARQARDAARRPAPAPIPAAAAPAAPLALGEPQG
jgi:nicotinamide mononucleotide adenylyltransferase